MTLSDLENYVRTMSVLSEEEINDETSKYVLDDTLDLINSFYPRLINTMSIKFPAGVRYRIWDITSDPVYNQPISDGLAIEENLGADFPSKVVAIDWTLESITEDNNTWLEKMTREIFMNTYLLYCSNKRRQANINELPFDLRGQDFYQEATDKLTELKTILVNSTPQIL